MSDCTRRSEGPLSAAFLACMTTTASAQETLDRTTLPIQEPERPTYSELDVRNVEAPPRFEVKAPAQAPNVIKKALP